jgi:hypothetical protein
METFDLGGRKFRTIETHTIELQYDLDRLVVETGLGAMLQKKVTPEEGGEHAARIWEAISRSGTAFAFLARIILPEPVADLDWSPEEAARTIAFVKKLHAPDDAATVRQHLIRLVISFFVAARDSSALSGIASPAAVAAPAA